MDLLDVLADSPSVEWRIARVKTIVAGPPYRVNLVMGSTTESEAGISTITGATVLESYVPVVQDIVHVIVHTRIGALVLGPARSAPPTPPPAVVELPRVSQFYAGSTVYNITSTDGAVRHNLGAAQMTNPDATRYILARGDYNAWGNVGVTNAGYLHSLVSGHSGAINVADSRIENDDYTSQYGAQYFTIAPKATATFRGTAYRANTDSTYTVAYLRVTITAINWRPNGSI